VPARSKYPQKLNASRPESDEISHPSRSHKESRKKRVMTRPYPSPSPTAPTFSSSSSAYNRSSPTPYSASSFTPYFQHNIKPVVDERLQEEHHRMRQEIIDLKARLESSEYVFLFCIKLTLI
jgi:hypothetical protein